jgi:hypothetical protein
MTVGDLLEPEERLALGCNLAGLRGPDVTASELVEILRAAAEVRMSAGLLERAIDGWVQGCRWVQPTSNT